MADVLCYGMDLEVPGRLEPDSQALDSMQSLPYSKFEQVTQQQRQLIESCDLYKLLHPQPLKSNG